jgi:hypothetical protein
MDPLWGPTSKPSHLGILQTAFEPSFSIIIQTQTKNSTNSLKHSIFTTSWEALYFYRNYFEAVTSTQKFANSFSKDSFLWTLRGPTFWGVPTFKGPSGVLFI